MGGRRRSAGVGWLVVFVAACSYDREVLYEEPAASQTLPLLPFTPDAERVDECTACAMESCTVEREACVADAACAELLGCRGDCDDPACLAQCGERTHWDVTRAGFPQNETFARYEECVALRACGAECGWGKNWGCVGEYAWPAPEDPSHLPLELELRGSGGFIIVARVTSCENPTCSQPLDEAETDAWGQAALDVGSSSLTGRFEVLELDFGDGLGGRLYTPPVFRTTRVVAQPTYKAMPELRVFFPDLPELSDPTSTVVGFTVVDCLGATAPGVRFELLGEAPGRRSFYGGNGFLTPAATATDATGVGGFLDAPAGAVVVRAVDSEGKRLAERSISLAAGTTTSVALVPATEGD